MPATSIPIPQLKFGKRKERSQVNEVFTDDGRIVTVELDVQNGCQVDEPRQKAFFISPENQYTSEMGVWTQIIDENSSIPFDAIEPIEIEDLQDLENKIYHESAENAKTNQYIRAANDTKMDKLMWIVVIVCCTFIIFFVGSGKFEWPF